MRRPPTAGPVTIPIETNVPMKPSALPRSYEGNASVRMAAPRERIITAPIACTMRKPISMPTLVDRPHIADATVNSANPEV
jgi:hypothetical protein